MPVIKLTNDVLLDASILENAIDPSNVLKDGDSTTLFTAPESCYVFMQNIIYSTKLYIDGVMIQDMSAKGTGSSGSWVNGIYLRKGQTFKTDNSRSMKIYGTK